MSRFAGSRYFRAACTIDNYARLVRAIDTGEVMMGLVVPRDFAQNIDAGRDAPVQVIVDGSDSNTATIAIGYAQTIAQIYALDLAARAESAPRRAGGRTIPLDVRPRVWFNEELESQELHHSRADRRDHDGDRGDAHLADHRPRVGAGHDGAIDLDADHAAAS